MKALVTGGMGFIGSYLTKALLRDGHEVWAIDDLSTGSVSNLDDVWLHKRLHTRIGDVTDSNLIGELVDRVDVVFHLAAAVGVSLVMEHPTHTLHTNIKGTEVVLQAASKKSKRVFVASTSEVYGKSDKLPYSEEDDIMLGSATNSRWGYACSKAIDEYLALAYYQEKGLPVTVVRFFNTIGPGQTGRYGMVVPRFVRQALSGEDITVYGDGEQCRGFAYVGEVVYSLINLLELPEAVGEIYNVGNDEEISMNELAGLVKRLTGSQSKVVHIPYDEVYTKGFEDCKRRIPDITKLYKATGSRPREALVKTLARIIADE